MPYCGSTSKGSGLCHGYHRSALMLWVCDKHAKSMGMYYSVGSAPAMQGIYVM